MSVVQGLALATGQNTLGWSRTRFYGKNFLLSDLCLCCIANWNARLVGTNATAGGIFILDQERLESLKAGEEVLLSDFDPSTHNKPSDFSGV
jgi:hypothetical protein